MIKKTEHVLVGGGNNLICHWPRQGGIWKWGNEIAVAYIESPGEYKDKQETDHGQDGIWKSAYIRLSRSYDSGETWENDGKIFDNSLPVEEQRKALNLSYYYPDLHPEPPYGYVHYFEVCGKNEFPKREAFNPSEPDSIILMGRAWCGTKVKKANGSITYKNVSFAYRSSDRGKTWEKQPTIILPHDTETIVELANNYFLNKDRIYAWFVGYDGVEGEKTATKYPNYSLQLYASDNNGESFDFYQEIYRDPLARTASSYPHIIRLDSGRWLCFMNQWHVKASARIRWVSLSYSDDEGLNWSKPKTIQSWAVSPFPLLLRDGRIAVISMRRNPDPTGLMLIISEDQGETWSEPEFIRTDTLEAGPLGGVDGGYPVAVEMEDNRIFTAYYWQKNDEDIPWYGGRKFIAGTFFELV